MSSLSLKNRIEALVEVIVKENVENKVMDPIIFPAKYFDYADIFDKRQVDVLSKHNQYDFAIKIEKDQILPFGSIYNHSKLELEVFYKYINDMLKNKLIIPFKSPSKASVLFTKKNNGGLCLCIDFCGLNAMTKKNKHPLPLIYTLLDLLARAKYYTKIDLIAVYNLLCIK